MNTVLCGQNNKPSRPRLVAASDMRHLHICDTLRLCDRCLKTENVTATERMSFRSLDHAHRRFENAHKECGL